MFLRATPRKKEGKAHRYWSIVENRRLADGRVLQRHVLYLGEINDSQQRAGRRSIEVLDAGAGEARSLALLLYACHDRLLAHKCALFDHHTQRWRELFQVRFDVLLYDLTSTDFESNPPFAEGDKRHFGYSRDHRGDGVQLLIALIVTPEGLPLAYEVLPGNTVDNPTLRDFLARSEAHYGRARRTWVMDPGIPTEAVLEQMRAANPPVHRLVGTPKGRLTRLEKALIERPWQTARAGVQLMLLPQDGELYVFAQSADRLAKERAMRRREGRYLLRTNLTHVDPAELWNHYLQLLPLEAAFRHLKGDLAIRPIYHQHEQRIEAHIFIAFLAYCLHVTPQDHRRQARLATPL